MSMDWIVTWPKNPDEPLPDKQVIWEVLEDFLTDLCEKIQEHSPGFLTAQLRGNKNFMFRRHGYSLLGKLGEGERWFEVWVRPTGITVTTRMQDDVTNCLAAEFARRCAQRWSGILDEPG